MKITDSETRTEKRPNSPNRTGPFQATVNFSVKLVERWLPDPFVLVLLLSVIVFLAGMLVERQTPLEMVRYWGEGFWNLLNFAMQMILVLITGYTLARSPLFSRMLRATATIARTPRQAIILVTLVSLSAAWINWGFGLVIGALFARELARKVKGVHYPLLIASAYTGYLVWHGGISGAIPLSLASKGIIGNLQTIPIGQSVFSTFNLIIVATLFIAIPLVNSMMMGKPEDTVSIDESAGAEEDNGPILSGDRPADKLNNSVILAQIIGLAGLAFLFLYFIKLNGNLDFNSLIFIFLILAIILHGRPSSFLHSANEAMKGAGGIAIQFPFYAGLMGIIMGSGLGQTLSEMFVSISNPDTFPLFAFLSAGLLNIFIPSGGGQWAVQGPIMMQAGAELGVDPVRTAMAVAWGDAWTNMIQPFWALPALAIAGLSAKDIMGYCLIILFVSGTIIGLGLVFI
jgi:short-chain fatty acids transporter